MMEKREAEEREKQLPDHKGMLWEISDTIKWNYIRIIGVPEEEERERGIEGIFEKIIAEDFPNLCKETGIEVREAQRTPPQNQ